jgi:hypothetical protein
MEPYLQPIIWRQFGSAIDMLENAMRACPDDLWKVQLWPVTAPNPELSAFWYIAYHTLFWLDLYLTGAVEGFAPPEPFTLDELDPAGLTPERTYTKDELQTYLEHDRTKCQATIDLLTDERAWQICKFPWGEVPFLELLLDNMRHVQEHAAQLNMILGQKIRFDPGWITRPKNTDAK